MKRLRWLAILVPLPVFLILSGAGRAFPQRNPCAVDLVVSNPVTGELGLVPEMVAVSHFLQVSRYETTFAQYDLFCAETGREPSPDQGNGRGDRPAGCVSWYDAVEYCNWLSLRQELEPCYTINRQETDPESTGDYDLTRWTVACDLSASGYRLPTEEEWEFAARGGALSRDYHYSGSNDIDEVAWYWNNAGRHPQPVGQKIPNELGLYDMSGNVYEWTADWRSENGARVVRGGSCFYDAKGATLTHRKSASPGFQLPYLGFRVVRRTSES